MVVSGRAHNTGSLLGDGMGIRGYIGGSRSCEEPLGHCGFDREGFEAVAFGVLRAKGARRRGEGLRAGDFFFYDSISVEI